MISFIFTTGIIALYVSAFFNRGADRIVRWLTCYGIIGCMFFFAWKLHDICAHHMQCKRPNAVALIVEGVVYVGILMAVGLHVSMLRTLAAFLRLRRQRAMTGSGTNP
jgi:hypothetical protein